MAEPVYKVLSEAAFEAAWTAGRFDGSADDARDGFIHLSAGHQLAATLATHFAGQDGLVLVALDAERLGPSSEMGGFARRRAVPASLRAARSCRRAVERTARSRTGRAPRSAGRSVRVSGLFGLGQSLLLAGARPGARPRPRRQEPRAWALSARRRRPTIRRLAQTVFGLDFPNPVGMAAGFDKNARVPRELLAMGFGFVEVGTLTPLRAKRQSQRPACSAPLADRAIINRLGFNNEGQEAALARLQDRPPGDRRRQCRRRPRQRRSHRRLRDGHRAHGARWRATSPSISHRPIRRACAISRRRRRSMSCSSACRPRASALPRKPPLLVKLAPDLADADLPEVVRRDPRARRRRHRRVEHHAGARGR